MTHEVRAEATVNRLFDADYTDLETIVAAIARSPIVVANLALHRRLPAGFDAVDVAILDWIAAEGRRAGQNFIRM
jgi:hypothetical protein